MNKKWLAVGLVLGLVAMIGMAATTDRFSGTARSWDYSCFVLDNPIASQASLDLQCAHIMPQAATLVGFQVTCVTETGGAKTFDVMEGVGGAGVVAGTLEYDAGALTPFDTFTAGVGTLEVADGAIIMYELTTVGGESATECTLMSSWWLH